MMRFAASSSSSSCTTRHQKKDGEPLGYANIHLTSHVINGVLIILLFCTRPLFLYLRKTLTPLTLIIIYIRFLKKINIKQNFNSKPVLMTDLRSSSSPPPLCGEPDQAEMTTLTRKQSYTHTHGWKIKSKLDQDVALKH